MRDRIDTAGNVHTLTHIGMPEDEGRMTVQVGDIPGVARRVVVQTHHRVTAPQERLTQMGPEEAPATGHNNTHSSLQVGKPGGPHAPAHGRPEDTPPDEPTNGTLSQINAKREYGRKP
ncbi:hypothetical protein GCM10010363_76390 [Streptomyces omiyaensis]|nr:hypothetical protein GCM10010363_76390 [Streptomyces omiyaensis]